MDSFRCLSKGITKSNETSGDDKMSSNIPQMQHRKFNPTPAPISRPPSSMGNRITKIQKIKTNPNRKRHKWNDRFHLDTNDPMPVPTHSQIPPKKKSNQARKKRTNSYSNIHSKRPIQRQKKKNKASHSMIPPIDVVSGKRKWGTTKNKKRAKWSMINNKNNSVANRQRAKWKKPKTNPLSESRSRVLPILPKSNEANHQKTDEQKEAMSMNLNTEQKQEFACLFSNILKNIIQSEDKKEIIQQIEQKKVEKKEEAKEEEEEECVKNIIQIPSIPIKRAKKRLLPITKRNQDENEQRKQYFEPLNKVADIILDDLIKEVSDELDSFCCHIVDILIESETNI